MRSIKIRSASGRVTESVELVRERTLGLRNTHNGDTAFPRIVGEAADGTMYETSSRRGWRRALDQDAARGQLHEW
jgi:hypothetical protein